MLLGCGDHGPLALPHAEEAPKKGRGATKLSTLKLNFHIASYSKPSNATVQGKTS